MSWLRSLPQQPWLLELIGDPVNSHSGPFLNVRVAPLIAGLALLMSLILATKRWKGLRLGSAKQFSPYPELVVLFLLGLALVFVMRPIHQIQLEVLESHFGKMWLGTFGPLEIILAANSWLPWFVGAIGPSLMVGFAARLRQAKPGVARPSVPWLLGIGLSLNVVALLPLALAVHHFVQAGLAVLAYLPRGPSVAWTHFLVIKAEVPHAFRGFSFTVVVAAVVLTVAYFRRTRFSVDPTQKNLRARGAWIGTGVCLGLSLFFYWMTQPVSAELRQPIPIDHCFVNMGLGFLPAPSIEGVGPDSLADAPVVEYWNGYHVDRTKADNAQALENILMEKVQLWKQVNPNQHFPGRVTISIITPMSLESMREAFAAVVQSGYPEVTFLLSDVIRITQPVFGTHRGVSESAVAMRVSSDSEGCEGGSNERIQLPTQGGAKEFVYGLIPLRKQHRMPCLVLPGSWMAPPRL